MADLVWQVLDRRAESDGTEPWLTFAPTSGPQVTLRAADVRDRALAIAGRLAADGVQPGERVAVLSRNSAEYLVMLFALARHGAVLVPLNWLLTAPELAYQIGDAGAVALVTEQAGTDRLDAAAAEQGWAGRRYCLDGAADGWPAIHDGPTADLPALPRPDDLFEILYTSGSTSHPKGVMLSNRAVARAGYRLLQDWEFTASDVFLTPLPLFHVNAQLISTMSSLVCGGRLVLQDAFSATAWIDQCREHGATVVPLVGTQIRILMEQPALESDSQNSLRFMPYGLNVPVEMWHAFEERYGAPLINMYGLSEGLGIVTAAPLRGDRRIPTVGTATSGLEVAVFDDEGKRVVDQPGEIRARGVPGETLMLGYHNQPELSAETLAGNWLHTGDLGSIDPDGYLTYVDRIKDVIKPGGENVSATEVENVLCDHPSVGEAGVVGRPDPIRDERVVAFVAAREGQEVDVDELRAHCDANLARFKRPAEYIVLDRLPRSTIGKLEKKTMRAMLEEHHGES